MYSVNNFIKDFEDVNKNFKIVDEQLDHYRKYSFRAKFIEDMNKIHPIKDSCRYINSEHYFWQAESYSKKSLYATKKSEESEQVIYIGYGNNCSMSTTLGFTFFSSSYETNVLNDNHTLNKLTIKLRSSKINSTIYEYINRSYDLICKLNSRDEEITLFIKNKSLNNRRTYTFSSISEFENSDVIDLLMIEEDIEIPKKDFIENSKILKNILHYPKKRNTNKKKQGLL